MIKAGKYRHLVTIRQAPTDATRDEYGERIGTGAVLASVWAEKQDWSGRETIESGRETPMVYTRFVMRYRADVLADMTVDFDNKTWRIDSVMDKDGRGTEITLMCKRNEADS